MLGDLGDEMKIASFSSRAVRIPRENSPALRGGDTMDFVTLTIRTDEGVEGIGYAGFQSPVMTRALKAAVDGLDRAELWNPAGNERKTSVAAVIPLVRG